MPSFPSETQTKIASLRALRSAGTPVEVYEYVGVEWPAPDGTIYYSCVQSDEVAYPPPDVSPIEVRLIPSGNPAWFIPLELGASIGDEEAELTFWDNDEVISQLLIDHGEGVRATFYYWFPQVDLLLPVWHGHLQYGKEEDEESITVLCAQGFRTSEATVPGRGHYRYCFAIFGGLLATQAEIDQHDCPYNKHIGGAVGINNPATSLPWTYCDRREPSSCTARGVNTLYHLSHHSVKTKGRLLTLGALLTSSHGNETFLKDPVRVVMGSRRLYELNLLAYSRVLTLGSGGSMHVLFECAEGPVRSLRAGQVTVGDETRNIDPTRFDFVLGTKGQRLLTGNTLGTHGYSGTAIFRYYFNGVPAADLGPSDCSASMHIEGLNDIRVYTDATTYTETYTTNRAWHLARLLCDKRWGFGLDYARLNKDSFIAAADWCDQPVRYTDPFGTHWEHVRSESNVELIGRKVQQQVEDLCLAGRLSRPFIFNGEIHIVPLKALTSEELAACPIFTDEGFAPNIVHDEDGKSTLKVGERKSVKELINRVECTFDNIGNSYLQRPIRPVEDVDAQLAAGRLVGDFSRKVNKKEYPLLGVVYEAQAIKLAWSLLDLGPNDDGGLQNNLPITMTVWFADALDLHPEKVIKVSSSRLTKYGFTYFRVKKITRKEDLLVELECQAYNETYMNTFETDIVGPITPGVCTVNSDCPEGFMCVDGVCEPIPPECRPGFGAITLTNGTLNVTVPPC